jgi:hypothetical protein
MLSFLDKTILDIITSPNNLLKHTILPRRKSLHSLWIIHSNHLKVNSRYFACKFKYFDMFTDLQNRCFVSVSSTALCRVAPWCNRRTASFRPPLGILTSIQNLGGSWFSLSSIDLHMNYYNFRRTSSNLSEFLQHELTCCPPNRRIT